MKINTNAMQTYLSNTLIPAETREIVRLLVYAHLGLTTSKHTKAQVKMRTDILQDLEILVDDSPAKNTDPVA